MEALCPDRRGRAGPGPGNPPGRGRGYRHQTWPQITGLLSPQPTPPSPGWLGLVHSERLKVRNFLHNDISKNCPQQANHETQTYIHLHPELQ